MQLRELLTEGEVLDVGRMLDRGAHDELRAYLNERADKLLEKGVVADYLYYVLLAHGLQA